MPRLGLLNILRVFGYRVQLRSGIYRRRHPIQAAVTAPVLSESSAPPGNYVIRYFSHHDVRLQGMPDWARNYLHDRGGGTTAIHWSLIPDFSLEVGDIKCVWELSRFDWLPKAIHRIARPGNKNLDIELAQIEALLRDWNLKNPKNQGINWKCGQETAIRATNLITAWKILRSAGFPVQNGLISMLSQHAERIESTLQYAIAQDNNHGISEAAGLFLIGGFLIQVRRGDPKGPYWERKGRSLLENRVRHLFMDDGSFAQHSTVYHRMAMDYVSVAELFRRDWELEAFSETLQKRMASAVEWLDWMIMGKDGDAPNLGANDGTYLFNLDERPYRDFRPSVELGQALFKAIPTRPTSTPHALMTVFSIDPGRSSEQPEIGPGRQRHFPDGGYVVWHRGHFSVLLRTPCFRFRPSHADGLSIDVWHDGIPVIGDSGTYSYNHPLPGGKIGHMALSSTAMHSTALLDGVDQMPRLGRFLFGEWLTETGRHQLDADDGYTSAYVDFKGRMHERTVRMHEGVEIEDYVSGSAQSAILGWQCHALDLRESANDRNQVTFISEAAEIAIKTEGPKVATRLLASITSRHYLALEEAIRLEMPIEPGNRYKTVISSRPSAGT